MLNHIWAWMIVLSIIFGLSMGIIEMAKTEGNYEAKMEVLKARGLKITNSAIDSSALSVDICLGLIGRMAMWLGMMKIALDAGLVKALAHLLRPVMRFLFPDVPDDHPANGAMLMNIAANMLGLDNAATPFGLKAMTELQDLNEDKETATNAMVTFLAINTSSVNIIPFTIIAYRASEPFLSKKPAEVLFPMLIATTISTIVAVIAVKVFARLKIFDNNKKEAPNA